MKRSRRLQQVLEATPESLLDAQGIRSRITPLMHYSSIYYYLKKLENDGLVQRVRLEASHPLRSGTYPSWGWKKS